MDLLGRSRSNQRGMSMVELVIVVAVSLVLAAILLPNAMNSIFNIRLRAAANEVAGLLQQARYQAIRDNTYYPVRVGTIGSTTVFYVDTSATKNTSTWSNSFPSVQLGGRVARQTSGFPAVTSMSLGFTPLAANSIPYFSARGTPCSMNGNVCQNIFVSAGISTIAAYQIFLSDARPGGGTGWAAVTISPAGRVRVWMWDGAKWE